MVQIFAVNSHNEVWTKWPTFRRWQLNMRCRDCEISLFDFKVCWRLFLKFQSKMCHLWYGKGPFVARFCSRIYRYHLFWVGEVINIHELTNCSSIYYTPSQLLWSGFFLTYLFFTVSLLTETQFCSYIWQLVTCQSQSEANDFYVNHVCVWPLILDKKLYYWSSWNRSHFQTYRWS